MSVFLAKERTEERIEPFLDDVIMIIANDQILGFCYKRKNMFLIRILLMVSKH